MSASITPSTLGTQESHASDFDYERYFKEFRRDFGTLKQYVAPGGSELYETLNKQITEIQKNVTEVLTRNIFVVRESDLPKDEWLRLGSGAFGIVFKINFQGNAAALKIFKVDQDRKLRESDILRGLSHDNVIAYRGTGLVSIDTLKRRVADDVLDLLTEDSRQTSFRFLIMEYLPYNLERFVESSPIEGRGLSDDRTCSVGEQIANALGYLHSKNIAHRDLKPDNVLYDPERRIVKLADFGLAWHEDPALHERRHGSVTTSKKHVRWSAPELLYVAGGPKLTNPDRYKHGDIWSLGMVLTFCITRKKPFADWETANMDIDVRRSNLEEKIPLPVNLPDGLRNVVESCRQRDPEKRPTADYIVSELAQLQRNLEIHGREFFCCGFLKKTNIFVADSFVTEDSVGYFNSKVRPEGYDHKFLRCPVETDEEVWYPIPEEWNLESKYQETYCKFMEMADAKTIDNNPSVALKKLTMARPGKDEVQLLEMRFQQSTYCHHRAMRELWTLHLTPEERQQEVPCLAEVHPYYSTSFGLHVAVLTNEGPDLPRKFIFCQRARRPGMSSPGAITCGAVEGCSINDFDKNDYDIRVNLIKTAARGLHEELGVELTGNDLDAITLNTVYLKFDTHEWGICGFVDLGDDRIDPDRRISFANLEYRFTSGPKDKFEHQSVIPVDFELEKMADFIHDRHDEFASSAKLVVVKVMQAFFGVERVQKELELRQGK